MNRVTALCSFCFIFLVLLSQGCSTPPSSGPTLLHLQETPSAAAIASAHPLATDAGLEILKEGGNAFDAAIAVASALAVVEPYGSGIGGGGFWLLYEAKSDRYVMVDARERAPLAAHKGMYLNKQGEVDRDLATNSPLSAGIPGQVAAFEHISNHYGTLPLARSLEPAIRLAGDGFPVTETYNKLLSFRKEVMRRYPKSARTFLDKGALPAEGRLIIQQDLQKTLKTIAKMGGRSFYQGQIAIDLVNAVQAAGGIWTLDDLAQYQVIERQPIIGHYHDAKIISAAPPSSGGIALVSMFNMLEAFEHHEISKTDKTHLLIEVMRRAYFDRARHLGDPDYHKVPTSWLTSRDHAHTLMQSYSATSATPSEALGPLITETPKGENTTHLSVMDQYGNRVSATLSINFAFGSGFTAGNTGILLNNEMDDFSAKPGAPNAYGLVGSEANAIEPGKRPLSSMTPTMIEMPDRIAILGTPGGSRIITMVFLASLQAIEGAPPTAWVRYPRFHHQYLPNVIQFEPDGLSLQTVQSLEERGHTLKPMNNTYGNMHGLLWDRVKGKVSAASDPRGIGAARVLKQTPH